MIMGSSIRRANYLIISRKQEAESILRGSKFYEAFEPCEYMNFDWNYAKHKSQINFYQRAARK